MKDNYIRSMENMLHSTQNNQKFAPCGQGANFCIIQVFDIDQPFWR